MGGLKQDIASSEPKTALSAGGLALDDPNALKPRMRTVKRKGIWLDSPKQVQPWLAEGRANIEDLEYDMFDRFARRQTPENYDDTIGAASALFRAPSDEHILLGLKRTADALDQGIDPARVFADPVRQKKFEEARQAIKRTQTDAAEIRAQSGLYAGVATHERMAFRHADGREAFSLPSDAGRIALSDARYRDSFTLIGAALGNGDGAKIAELASQAVRKTAVEATVFDDIAIDPVEARIAIAGKYAQALRTDTLTEAERKAHLDVLTATLFIEAMPQSQFFRLLFDSLPGTGNLREGERGYESLVAAKNSFAEGNIAKAFGHVLAATMHGLGAVTGRKGPGAIVSKALSKAPGAKAVRASYEIAQAQRIGNKPLPSQPLAKFAQPDDIRRLNKAQRDYAESIFNHAKGEVTENHINDRLRTLGLNMNSKNNGSSRNSRSIVIPGKNRIREYDGAAQEKILTKLIFFVIPRKRKGWTVGLEAKADASIYTKPQSSADEKILSDAAKARNEKSIAQNQSSQNSPPDIADNLGKSTEPKMKANAELEHVDQVILARLPITQLDHQALVRVFERMVVNPRNSGMARVKTREWSKADLEKIIEVARNAEVKKHGGVENVIVGDLVAGVLARLTLIGATRINQAEAQ